MAASRSAPPEMGHPRSVGTCCCLALLVVSALGAAAAAAVFEAEPAVCDLRVARSGQNLPSLMTFTTLQAAVDAAIASQICISSLESHCFATICIAPAKYTCRELAGGAGSIWGGETRVNASSTPIMIRADPALSGRVVLDCERSGRALSVVSSAAVAVRGIDFVNGIAQYGGAVAAWESAALSFDDCTFASLRATCQLQVELRLHLTHVSSHTSPPITITRNQTQAWYRAVGCGARSDALFGTWVQEGEPDLGLPIISGGGAVSAQSVGALNITRCTFSNVHALSYGGALSLTDVPYVTVDRCDFKNATAPFVGGALAMQFAARPTVVGHTSSLTVSDSNFTDIDGGGVGGGGVGGLFQAHKTSGVSWLARGSSFVACRGGTGNTSQWGGAGGIGLVILSKKTTENATLAVLDSQFQGCVGGTETLYAGGAGGAAMLVATGTGISDIIVRAVDTSFVDCVGGKQNVFGGSGGFGLVMISYDLIQRSMFDVDRCVFLGCDGGSRNSHSGEGNGGGGGAGMVIKTLLGSPLSDANKVIRDTRVQIRDSLFTQCTGGNRNLVTGGGGGFGLVIDANHGVGEVANTSVIVTSTTMRSCAGGTSNGETEEYVAGHGGGGGLGVVIAARNGIRNTMIIVRNASAVKCTGGLRNGKLGGAGGVGVVLMTHQGDVVRTEFALEKSSFRNCVGGMNNAISHGMVGSGSGGGGAALIVIGHRDSIHDTRVIARSTLIADGVCSGSGGSGGFTITLETPGSIGGTSIIINNMTMVRNAAPKGGGLRVEIGPPHINVFNILHNEGGFRDMGGSIRITGSLFEENVADGVVGGGGMSIFLAPSEPVIYTPWNCIAYFNTNETQRSGNINGVELLFVMYEHHYHKKLCKTWGFDPVYDATPHYRTWRHLTSTYVVHSIFRKNLATSGSGGAMHLRNGRTVIDSSRIAANGAAVAGAGIHVMSNDAYRDFSSPPPSQADDEARINKTNPDFALGVEGSSCQSAALRGGAEVIVNGTAMLYANVGLRPTASGIVAFASSRTNVTFGKDVSISMLDFYENGQSQFEVIAGNAVRTNGDWKCQGGHEFVNMSSERVVVEMAQWFPKGNVMGFDQLDWDSVKNVDNLTIIFQATTSLGGYQESSSMRCSRCGAGTYAQNGTKCLPCPTAHVADGVGFSECKKCSGGRAYVSALTCATCESGRFIESGGDEGDSCRQCKKGFISARGASYCTPCSFLYATTEGQATCIVATWVYIVTVSFTVSGLFIVALFSLITGQARARETVLHQAARSQNWKLVANIFKESAHPLILFFAPGRDRKSPLEIILAAPSVQTHDVGNTTIHLSDVHLAVAVGGVEITHGDMDEAEIARPTANGVLSPRVLVQAGAAASSPGSPSRRKKLMTRTSSALKRASIPLLHADAADDSGNEFEETSDAGTVVEMLSLQDRDAEEALRMLGSPGARSAEACEEARQALVRLVVRRAAVIGGSGSESDSCCRKAWRVLRCGERRIEDAATDCFLRAHSVDTPREILWPLMCVCLHICGPAAWKMLLVSPSDDAEAIATDLAQEHFLTVSGENVVHTLVQAHVADLVDPLLCAQCIKAGTSIFVHHLFVSVAHV